MVMYATEIATLIQSYNAISISYFNLYLVIVK